MDAHQIERQLRGMPADGFAITREEHSALFDATGMRQRNVHGAHGLFLGPAARSGDAGDPHAQCAADVTADALGQRDRHFTAYGAFGLDEFRRDIRPRRLQLVAIAHDPTQKIR